MDIGLDPKIFNYMNKKGTDSLYIFLQISGMC